MKKVIDGKLYDTETAESLCDVSPSHARTDFCYENTLLYRTKRGTYFIAGKGGARSRWAQSVPNGTIDGSGMQIINKEEARFLVETCCTVEEYEGVFGPLEEG